MPRLLARGRILDRPASGTAFSGRASGQRSRHQSSPLGSLRSRLLPRVAPAHVTVWASGNRHRPQRRRRNGHVGRLDRLNPVRRRQPDPIVPGISTELPPSVAVMAAPDARRSGTTPASDGDAPFHVEPNGETTLRHLDRSSEGCAASPGPDRGSNPGRFHVEPDGETPPRTDSLRPFGCRQPRRHTTPLRSSLDRGGSPTTALFVTHRRHLAGARRTAQPAEPVEERLDGPWCDGTHPRVPRSASVGERPPTATGAGLRRRQQLDPGRRRLGHGITPWDAALDEGPAHPGGHGSGRQEPWPPASTMSERSTCNLTVKQEQSLRSRRHWSAKAGQLR